MRLWVFVGGTLALLVLAGVVGAQVERRSARHELATRPPNPLGAAACAAMGPRACARATGALGPVASSRP